MMRREDKENTDGDEEFVELYCLCLGQETENMIACDNPNCELEWFHFDCVDLEAADIPEGEWFCPDCTGKRLPIELYFD